MAQKRINFNRFQPVKIEATFALNTTQVNEDNEDIEPILNKDLPTNTSTEVNSVYFYAFFRQKLC